MYKLGSCGHLQDPTNVTPNGAKAMQYSDLYLEKFVELGMLLLCEYFAGGFRMRHNFCKILENRVKNEKTSQKSFFCKIIEKQ